MDSALSQKKTSPSNYMEQSLTPEPADEQPRRLTRVEWARLEALKSFGCEDFASVLRSAKKVSLKIKLNHKKENEESKGSKQTRRASLRRSRSGLSQKGRIRQRRSRTTKAQLAMVESLRSFENNSLADINRSSIRIVSKFLNKPKKRSEKISESATSKDANICCENHEICASNATQELDGGGTGTYTPNNTCVSLKVNIPVSLTNTIGAQSGWSTDVQNLLDRNRRVLDIAKQLDL